MVSISLEIPEHLILAILKKSREFLVFVRSCRFINGLIEANLNSFNIWIGGYFNIGMINRHGNLSPHQKCDNIPDSRDAKIHYYNRFCSEVNTIFYEAFEFSQLGEHLQRLSWCKPSIIKFGCSIRIPDDIDFPLEKFQKVLEELEKIKMTCNRLEMFTFMGAEDALRILKPKQLEIILAEKNKQSITEESSVLVQKLIAGRATTRSLSLRRMGENPPKIGEFVATLANLPNQITLKDEQDEISLVLIPQEGNCVTITVSKTRFELKIDIRFAKTFDDFMKIHSKNCCSSLSRNFESHIDQIKRAFECVLPLC